MLEWFPTFHIDAFNFKQSLSGNHITNRYALIYLCLQGLALSHSSNFRGIAGIFIVF